MFSKIFLFVALPLLLIVACSESNKNGNGNTNDTVRYDEAQNGDLSGDMAAPTKIMVKEGDNLVKATSVSGDVEYFTFNVPNGMQLAEIVLESYESNDDVAFIGLQAGSSFTEPTTGTDVGNLLGWLHINSNSVSKDILGDIGKGAGAQGFTPPLESGNYTFWTQQTGPEETTYTLNFKIKIKTNGNTNDTVRHDEAQDGDLSGDMTAPTTIMVKEGDNLVKATSVSGDVEYFTFNVPNGMQLAEIVLESYESNDDVAFIGLQTGSSFTEPAIGTDVSKLLGWLHINSNLVSKDILDDIGNGAGAQGFTPPLESGDYTFWTQQTGSEETTYTLNFKIKTK